MAGRAIIFSQRNAVLARPALVNGAVGLVVAPRGRLATALGFKLAGGKIVEIQVFADPARLHQIDLAVLPD